MITLGKISRSRLAGVHPDLIRVIDRAAALATSCENFTVLEGVRSKERMCINYGRGRSAAMCVAKGVPGHFADPAAAKVTWLDNPLMSNHRVHSDGYGHAVDLAPYPIDWNDHDGFRRLGALIKRAAAIEGIALAWGRDWRRPDLPHYELAA